MWFLIGLTAFFLIVFLVTRKAARGPGGIHDVGRHSQGFWGGAGAGFGGHPDAGDGWGGGGWGGGDGGGGWGGGDGGGGGGGDGGG